MTESPESRLLGVGWRSCMGNLWVASDGVRILTLEAALAELDGDEEASAA